jgi:Fe-S oxidoreductase
MRDLLSQDEELGLFLNKIASIVGENNILTSIEDLYTYSHVGEFGINHKYFPQAVIILRQINKTPKLIQLANEAGIDLIWKNQIQNDYSQKTASIIVDNRNPLDISELAKILREKKIKKTEKKNDAMKSKSILHNLTFSIQLLDGYRLADNPYSEDGFCIVHPFFDGLETFTSKGRLLLSKGLAKGEIAPSIRMVESIYNCTTCGQCYDQLSDNSLDINNVILKTREKLVELGYAPKQCRQLIDNILNEKNPIGMSKEDRALWYEETANIFNYENNSILYWPGCNASFRLPEIVESTSTILSESDVDFGLLGEREGCCGLILYLMGNRDKAKANASNVVNGFGSNLRTLVTSCAGCYYAFSQVYPKLGIDLSFNVLHSSQFIMQAIKNDKVTLGSLKGDFFWHDPCDLGRHSNVYEPPRFVLSSIKKLNLLEHPLNRQHTICCGAGGGLWSYNPELTQKISEQKFHETIPTNIDGIITGCPACILSLKNTAVNLRPKIKVYDISEIVAKCL